MSSQQVFFCPLLSRILCALLFLCSPWSAAASAPAELVAQAAARQLARDPYWRALLHYRQKRDGSLASEIISPEFFLAADGATSAQAELAATLAALFEPAGNDPENHAQCRFVARYKWLRKVLDWKGLEPPPLGCLQYRAYTMNGEVESLSLVYASGYLSNPASFYGHILLKFNSRRASPAQELLDQSLNFGAAVPRGENPVRYVAKGLFGGYDAVFSHEQFYRFNHAYAENELRDMWEYVLELSGDEVDQIVSHSWELLGRRYVYYFLKENCAYRMAELLELVIGERPLPDLPWSLPGVVFDRLASLERGGVPLVRSVRRIASRQNRFRGEFVSLAALERQAALEWVERGPDAAARYAALPEQSRIAVIDTLLDYYEYRIVADRADPTLKPIKQRLLAERAALPARSSPEEPDHAEPAAPPHEGPLPLMLRVGAAHNTHSGSGLALTLRPANYDHLSLDAGRIAHSQLTMFELKTMIFAHELRLRSLDLIHIENFNAARTPLPGDGGFAWKLRAGFDGHNLECAGCTVLKIAGGFGKAALLDRERLVFGMLDVSAQSAYAGSGTLAATPRIGLVAAATPAWKSYLSLGRQVFLNGQRHGERVARWENRFGSNRKWDLRLAYEENVAREWQAAVSFYW